MKITMFKFKTLNKNSQKTEFNVIYANYMHAYILPSPMEALVFPVNNKDQETTFNEEGIKKSN